MFFKLFLLRWRWHKVKYMYCNICSTLRHKLVLGILHTPRENKKIEPQTWVLSMIFLSKVYKGWPLLRSMLQPSVQLTAEKNWRWLKKNETELPRFCLGLQLGETQQKAAVLRPPTILLGLVAIAASGDCNRCPSISLWIDWHRLTVPSKHHALFMVVCLTTEDFSWYPWDDRSINCLLHSEVGQMATN